MATMSEHLAEQLNYQLMQSWLIYISFFTVVLSVNISAIGLVATKTPRGTPRKIISITFVLQNAIAIITGLLMAAYTSDVVDFFGRTNYHSLSLFRQLGIWGGIGGAIGHLLIGIAWLLVAFTDKSGSGGEKKQEKM
ncbi:MAG: hypothetical protein EA380_05495 [Phycisphaeraceae bacterium]|nr:MAG: hypothetical protein EA380_05495 [Phycisphaeraceae bacterium]